MIFVIVIVVVIVVFVVIIYRYIINTGVGMKKKKKNELKHLAHFANLFFQRLTQVGIFLALTLPGFFLSTCL